MSNDLITQELESEQLNDMDGEVSCKIVAKEVKQGKRTPETARRSGLALQMRKKASTQES